MFVQPPLGRGTIVTPVFIHGTDFPIPHSNKGNHVKRTILHLGEYADHRNNQIIQNLCLFYFPIPLTGIFTVGPDELVYGKMLVGTVPIYVCIANKKGAQSLGILGKNSTPKGFNIHLVPFRASMAAMRERMRMRAAPRLETSSIFKTV